MAEPTGSNPPDIQALDAGTEDRIDWFELSSEDKQRLFQRTGLINGVYADGSRSALPVLDPEKTGSLFHGLDLHDGTATAQTVYTQREFTFIQKGWTQASAEVSSPWISASVKYREEESSGRTSKTEHMYSTATYRIPTYQVQITEKNAASALSDDFLEAVREAVKDSKPREALQTLFEDYGYMIQLMVELGASITMSVTQKNTNETSEADTKTTLEAEVSGKYGDFAGGASFGKEDETSSKEVVTEQVGSTKINVNGGDKKLLTDTKKWLETTENINRLTIIGTFRVTTITRLIELNDKELYADVQKVFGQPLVGRWVPVRPQGTPDRYNLYVGFPDDNWAKEGWCTIGDSLASDAVLLVKDAPGHSGALIPCTFNLEGDFMNSYYPEDSERAFALFTYIAVPPSDQYASIGAVVRRPLGYNMVGPPDNFRAVRKDLLVPATFAYEPTDLLDSEYDLFGPPPVGWKLLPEDPKEGIDTGFFWHGSSDRQRDSMLQEGYQCYVLKKSAVEMLNTREDALAGK